MASIGEWTGASFASGNLPESWTAPNGLFPTQARNDGYTYTDSTATVTLPASGLADGYLLVAAYEYEDNSNGRFNPQARFVQASGTGNFVSATTGGYNRDTSEDRSYVRTFAFIDSPSASATIQFQWKADADDAVDGTVRSQLQVIPLYYANHGIYSSTSSALYGGTTPNLVTGFSVISESDTAAIEIASDRVTLKGDNKNYLVLGSQFYEGRGGRTQRWMGFRLDGTLNDAAKSCAYFRSTSDDENGDFFTDIVSRSTTDIVIDQACYRGNGIANGQGGADADGSTPSVGAHSFVILELNDSAEIFRSESSGSSGNIAVAGPTDLAAFPTANFSAGSSFTRVSDTAVNVNSAMDLLAGANIGAAQNNVATTARWTAFTEFTVNGAEQSLTFNGDYMRNNQGSIDTFGWSSSNLGALSVAANDDIGVSLTELTGTEGGGGNIILPAGWLGAWGVDLDSLQAGSDASGTASVSGAGATTATGQKTAQGTATASAGGAVLAAAIMGALGAAVVSDAGQASAQGTKQAESAVTVSAGTNATASGVASTGVSGTASVSGGGTVTTQGSKSAFGSLSVSLGGSVSATGQQDAGTSVVISAGGSTSASGLKDATQAVTASSGTQTGATGQKDTSAAVTVSAGGSVTATGVASTDGGSSVIISAGGNTSAQGRKDTTGTATVSAATNATAQGFQSQESAGSAIVSGSGQAVASGQKNASGAVSASAGTLTTATGIAGRESAVTVSAAGTVTATGLQGTPGTVLEQYHADGLYIPATQIDGLYQIRLTGDGLL